MRRAALVLGPITLLAGGIFACESDSNGGGGPAFELDGSIAPFDGGQQPFDSGPQPEASPDAPPGPPSVSVTVTGRAGPKAGVRVVFHDASGAVLETKLTDATGKATSSGTALPAMASALFGGMYDRQIVTWTALENGDDLQVRDLEGESDSGEPIGRYDVTMPGHFDVDGTSRYDVHGGGCYGFADGTTATIDLYPYCVYGNKTSVLVRALDPDNRIVGHSFTKGLAVPTDGGALPVATGAWAPSGTVTVTATNAPEDRPLGVEMLEIADGHAFTDGFSHLLDAETHTEAFPVATGFAEALQASIHLSVDDGRQIIAKRVAPGPTITFDASQALPAIVSSTVSGANVRRPEVSWTSSASLASTDGGLVRIRVYGEPGYTWTFIVPPGATSVTAPAMPPEADSHLPPVTDAGDGEAFEWPEITFVEADVLPSYTLLRRQAAVIAPPGASLTWSLPPMPMNGTYRTTSYVLAL